MTPTERLLQVAQGDMGLKEIRGSRHNPRIVEMFREVGHPEISDDETAWCAAATGAWLIEAGFPVPPRATNLMAMSYENYGIPATRFVPGVLCVFYRTAKRERDWRRHVGVGVSETRNTIKVIGGNQSNSVNIQTFKKADLVTMRIPVAPTAKGLKEAGSKDMQIAGSIKQIGTAVTATASTGAVYAQTKQAATPPPVTEPTLPPIDTSAIAEEMTAWKMMIEGAKALGDLIFAQPWLIAALGGGVGIYIAARWLEQQRIKRAKAGHPLSRETEMEGGHYVRFAD